MAVGLAAFRIWVSSMPTGRVCKGESRLVSVSVPFMGANDIRVRPESQYIFAETLARRRNVRVCVGIRGRDGGSWILRGGISDTVARG